MVRSTQKDYGEGTLKNSYWITDASHPSTIANLGYRPADETAPPDYSNNRTCARKMTIKLLERPETAHHQRSELTLPDTAAEVPNRPDGKQVP
jgi:hypothetical protein